MSYLRTHHYFGEVWFLAGVSMRREAERGCSPRSAPETAPNSFTPSPFPQPSRRKASALPQDTSTHKYIKQSSFSLTSQIIMQYNNPSRVTQGQKITQGDQNIVAFILLCNRRVVKVYYFNISSQVPKPSHPQKNSKNQKPTNPGTRSGTQKRFVTLFIQISQVLQVCASRC